MLDDDRVADDLTCVVGIDLASQNITVSLALLQRASSDDVFDVRRLPPQANGEEWSCLPGKSLLPDDEVKQRDERRTRRPASP